MRELTARIAGWIAAGLAVGAVVGACAVRINPSLRSPEDARAFLTLCAATYAVLGVARYSFEPARRWSNANSSMRRSTWTSITGAASGGGGFVDDEPHATRSKTSSHRTWRAY